MCREGCISFPEKILQTYVSNSFQDNESIPDDKLYMEDTDEADANVLRYDRHWGFQMWMEHFESGNFRLGSDCKLCLQRHH